MSKIHEKIEELKARYPKDCNIEGLEPAFTSDFMEFASYIKEEVVPEEVGQGNDDWENGYNRCRLEVVDKFKEMGV